MNLDIVKRLEDEANFCMKNPHYCSIRTFDILEDARGRIEELEKVCENVLVYIPEASVKFERKHYKVGQKLLTKAFRTIESITAEAK